MTTGPPRELTAAEEREFLKSRLHDYDRAELSELRAKLAGRWREQFCKPGTTHQIHGDVAICNDEDFA